MLVVIATVAIPVRLAMRAFQLEAGSRCRLARGEVLHAMEDLEAVHLQAVERISSSRLQRPSRPRPCPVTRVRPNTRPRTEPGPCRCGTARQTPIASDGRSASAMAQLAASPSDQSARLAHQAIAASGLRSDASGAIGFHNWMNGSPAASIIASASTGAHRRNTRPANSSCSASVTTRIGRCYRRTGELDGPCVASLG